LRQLRDAGVKVEHTGSNSSYDLLISLFGNDHRVECKVRDATRLGYAYQWLENADSLILRRDHDEPLVITRLNRLLELARLAETAHRHKEAYAVLMEGLREMVANATDNSNQTAPVVEASAANDTAPLSLDETF
jgi:hypothetical protein